MKVLQINKLLLFTCKSKNGIAITKIMLYHTYYSVLMYVILKRLNNYHDICDKQDQKVVGSRTN